MNENYVAPAVKVVGSVHDLTQGLDKVGTSLDAVSFINGQSTGLDGKIVPDPKRP